MKLCKNCKWHTLSAMSVRRGGEPVDDDYECTHGDVRLLAVTCPVTGDAGFLALGDDGHYVTTDPYPSCADVNAIDGGGNGSCKNWGSMP